MAAVAGAPRTRAATPPRNAPAGAPDAPLDPKTVSFEPVRLPAAHAAGEADSELRIPLFYIGDTAYTVPAEPRANIALMFLEVATSKGEEHAYAYMLRTLLGDDGYEALLSYKGRMTAPQLATIIAAAERLTVGALEAPKEDDATSG